MKQKFLVILLFPAIISFGQNKYEIPDVYSNLRYEGNQLIFQSKDSEKIFTYKPSEPKYTYDKIASSPTGTQNGIRFDFKDTTLNGTLYFGLINTKDKYPQPIFFHTPSKIKSGIAEINIRKYLSGKYDATGWESTGKMRIGYRITNNNGKMIFDGKINVKGKGPFEPDVTIISGPFINMVTDESAVISFQTNFKTSAKVDVDGTGLSNAGEDTNFEIKIDNLKPSNKYSYTIYYGNNSNSYEFTTAPPVGSRDPFSFTFASDSRAGKGGGERSIFGANTYMIKKIMAMNVNSKASFMQFTGDMISGYSDNWEEQKLQYYNWKNAIEQFAHYFPVNVGMGNHEALNFIFYDSSGDILMIDKFPFENESAESLFAQMFVNPLNGPKSEDGSKYDPNPDKTDFPSYEESVFYYTYSNTAMIVLNSDYFYAPTGGKIELSGGNLHGYIMDNQLQWFEETILELEKDNNIDHIFITLHTPAFPNGGHSRDDMWYNGNNSLRPYINSVAYDKGIIERRDEFLDIMINKSSKAIALLCGDEHNYNRMKLDSEVTIYPESWEGPTLEVSRPVWQITNGSAGAPYYAQEKLPWSNAVEFFSTQYALVFFNVSGNEIEMEVLNPDTGEKVDKVKIR